MKEERNPIPTFDPKKQKQAEHVARALKGKIISQQPVATKSIGVQRLNNN